MPGGRNADEKLVPRPPGHRQRLELDVDLRTTDVWREVSSVLRTGRLTMGVFAAALRAAYSLGYRDALSEDGKLFKEYEPC